MPKVFSLNFTAYQVTVSGSWLASERADVNNASTSASFPGFATSFAAIAFLTISLSPVFVFGCSDSIFLRGGDYNWDSSGQWSVGSGQQVAGACHRYNCIS
jgi:hypothetical protein